MEFQKSCFKPSSLLPLAVFPVNESSLKKEEEEGGKKEGERDRRESSFT